MSLKPMHLDKVLFEGQSRLIYQHPFDGSKVVKIERFFSSAEAGKLSLLLRSFLKVIFPVLSDNSRELKIYSRFYNVLKPYIPSMEKNLIATDQGLGLVSEKIVNADGSLPDTLMCYLEKKSLSDSLKGQLDSFFEVLVRNKIYFFDFNLHNFIIRTEIEKEFICFVDLKSYRKDRSLLSGTSISDALAMKKMERRMLRFYSRIGCYGHSG